jgi:hypothetical protein
VPPAVAERYAPVNSLGPPGATPAAATHPPESRAAVAAHVATG